MSIDPYGKRKTTYSILKKTMPIIQGQLKFECVALLSGMYRELVHWLQVSMKTHDSRLTFMALMVTTRAHIPTYMYSCILIDYII